ncbi:MAG TPA: hypothetical protein VGF24_36855 [Vicinamibacterales bacterium]|jgi:hypothetical protein
MKTTHPLSLFVAAAVVLMPMLGLAQDGDLTHGQAPVDNPTVGFGVLPTEPLGPPPCTQTPLTAIGGPGDPCAYKNHHLVPEEVTIIKGDEVTFEVHGGGHAPAIYEVSKDTTRDEIGQFLCPGTDPATITDPTLHPCNGTTPAGTTNAGADHHIEDGHGDVVIVSGLGGAAHPANRVWYVPGRLMAAGGQQFINGGAAANPPTPAQPGTLVTYQFLKTGRYLVICMNRSHFLNDWMFGFVNVVGGD